MQTGTPIFEPFLAGPDDSWDIPIVNQHQVAGGLKFFETEAGMNTWANKYTTRREKTVAFVFRNDADGEPQSFVWSADKFKPFELGTQNIPSAGIAFVNPDGSTTTGIEMLALQGLSLEGDADKGFTLKAHSGSIDVGTLTSNRYQTNKITFGPELEVIPQFDQSNGGVLTGAVVQLKPSFTMPKTAAWLAYVRYPELMYGKAKDKSSYFKGTVWPDMTRVSPGGLLPIDRDGKAIGLQETDNKDPNVSGGSQFLVWPFIYLDGNAPADGYVELIWYKKSDGTIATDVNGHPMAVRHNYKRGQRLTPPHDPLSFAQVMTAKGLTEYSLALVDNFDSYLKVLDYSEGPSGICIQELSDHGTTSDALLQAENDTGFNVRMESYYVGTYLASISYLTRVSEPAALLKAGRRADTVAGIELYAVSDIQADINQGSLQVGSSGQSVTDFYVGLLLSPEVTRMVAGEKLEAHLALLDKDSGWNVGYFAYTGDVDKRPPLYTSRNNGSITLGKGWVKVNEDFISEDKVSGLHSHDTPSYTTPKNADQIMVALYPTIEQNPISLTLKGFHVDASDPKQHVSVNGLTLEGLQHLDFMTKTVRMIQGISTKDATTGKVVNRFAGLRYTDTAEAKGLPMPFGVPQSPLKYLTLDKSLNVIPGSAAEGGEGALVASEQVEVTLYQKWQLYNELPDSHEADYWLTVTRDNVGVTTEIPHSRTTFMVDPNNPKVDYFTTNEVTITLEPGDYICVRSSSDVTDGAYAKTTQTSKPLCITYITEKYLG